MLFLATLLGSLAIGSAIFLDFDSHGEEDDDWVDRDGDDQHKTVSLEDLTPGGSDPDDDPSGGADYEGTDELDIIRGSDLDDTVSGLGGDDQLNGFEGDDDIHGDAGDDQLFGGEGEDSLFGDAGADTLHGEAGDDLLSGGTGEDELFGHFGTDTLLGGAGADSLHGGADGDLVDGGADADAVHGNQGADTVLGGAGQDTLFGGEDDDVVSGADDEGESDFLNGGAGDDTLIAGANDVVTGGLGQDQIVLGEWLAQDHVELVDFDRDEDQLLMVYDEAAGVPELDVTQDPDNPEETIVHLDGVEAMRLTGAQGLTAEDIHLVAADDADLPALASLMSQ